jgi:uncharacterized membrane protein
MPGSTNASTTDWALIFLTPWSQSTCIAAACLLVCAAATVVYSYRHVPRAAPLIALRLVLMASVFCLVLQPAIQLRVVRRVVDRIAIVVDSSRSMALGCGDHVSRWQRLQQFVARSSAALAALEGAHDVVWFDLAGPIADAAAGDVLPQGDRTDLMAGLEAAHGADGGKPLAGLVLLGDGADNVALVPDANGKLDGAAHRRLMQLGVPVNCIDVTADAPGPYTDLAVVDVRADAFAFVHNTFHINVNLAATGFAKGTGPKTLPVTLKKEGHVLAVREVAWPATTTEVTFQIKPDVVGDFIYTVSVPPQAGEATLVNNAQDFVVQVIRDKIRVLQVSGRPSWDERFLRQYLKDNANTDLVSFFILRTPTDDISVPESELSLIPFPVNKLFTTELTNFDVIIFQNFDFRPYRMAHYLPNIRDAVQDGLGFVMLGGDNSFADGGFLGTAIDDILPVVAADVPMRYGAVAPRLTEAGLRHPITDLSLAGQSRAEVFADLPAWTGTNVLANIAPGAQMLAADAKVLGSDGKPAPLIAAMEAGRGRTLSVATAALWRWQFAPGPGGAVSGRAYQRFWSNALRWLVRDPEHTHVRVVPGKHRVATGDSVDVGVTLLDADYQPIVGAHVQTHLAALHDASTQAGDYVTQDGGMAQIHYTDLPPGAYRLTATANINGLGPSKGAGVFVVDATGAEMRQGAPRPDTFAAIATATGGATLPPQVKSWERLNLIDPEVIQVDRRRNVTLWDNVYVLVGLTSLFAADWFLRRRRGFF